MQIAHVSATLLAASLLAPAAAPARAPFGEATALEAALGSVTPSNVSADIFFLASDELGGRDTPSDGLLLAARFLRARLMRLGFQPGAVDGYFHTYGLVRSALDRKATHVAIERDETSKTLEFGADYVFFRDVANVGFEGPTTFLGVGDGAELGETVFGEDGLGEDGLAGRWAVFLDSDRSWRDLRGLARDRGALGVIVVPNPEHAGAPSFTRNRPMAMRSVEGGLRLDLGEEEAPRAIFPYLYLSPSAGKVLVPDGPATPLGADLGATVTDVRAKGEEERIEVENVAGYWPGNDPVLSKEVLIVSAHYDHVGTRGGEIYNGADDNASGTTGLLAVAEGLAAYGPMRRSVLLLWVSGEEKGLLGSEAWARDPWLPDGAHAVTDLNIDMIGRNEPDKLLITPTSDHDAYNGLTRMAEGLAPLEGFPSLGSADEYWNRSDHASFSEHLGIPVAFLFSDVHEDYHEPGDDPEKIDCDKIARVSRLVLRMLDGLQTDTLDL